MTDWAVLTSSTGHELSVRDEILALGVDAYCPVMKHRTKPKRKSKPIEIIQAAFPGYLFADSSFIDFSVTPLLMSSHIHQLRMGDSLCTIGDDEINKLRDEDETRLSIRDQSIKFGVGDHVRVKSGPLVGHNGLISASNGQRCELALVGFTTKIHMPVFSLEKIEASKTLQ